MNFLKTALATTAIAASFGASAQVTGSLGGGNAPFLSLSAPQACTAVTPCTLGLGVATIVGGTTYISDQPFADMPAGFVFEDRFLAAGPTSSQPSTMTFSGGGRDYISFLWGSPETHNQLTVNSTAGSQLFTAVALGLALGDGSFYVEFDANPGVMITSFVFNNIPAINAFEVANFSITSVPAPPRAAPEPATYALLLAGLVAVGYVGRRNRKRTGSLQAM